MRTSLRPLAFLSTICRYSSYSPRPAWGTSRRSAISIAGRTFLVSLASGSKIGGIARAAQSLTELSLGGSTTTTTTSTTTTMAAAASTSSTCSGGTNNLEKLTGYLDAQSAAALDQELMSEPGFSVEQLMELAGLAVAQAVYAVVEEDDRRNKSSRGGGDNGDEGQKQILIVCGPGNNGGDGLVAARHLVLFGYRCDVVYPKQSKKQHFLNLVKQCEDVGVNIMTEMPGNLLVTETTTDASSSPSSPYAAVVDAIFGFSFRGEPREPFRGIIQQMIRVQDLAGVVTVAVDVPSGWNVDEGDVAGTGFVPDALISLTAPKNCVREYTGRHFVGGRFLPPALAEKYNVRMPPYPGTSQVMDVTAIASGKPSAL